MTLSCFFASKVHIKSDADPKVLVEAQVEVKSSRLYSVFRALTKLKLFKSQPIYPGTDSLESKEIKQIKKCLTLIISDSISPTDKDLQLNKIFSLKDNSSMNGVLKSFSFNWDDFKQYLIENATAEEFKSFLYLFSELNWVKGKGLHHVENKFLKNSQDYFNSELIKILLQRVSFDDISDQTYKYSFFDFYSLNFKNELYYYRNLKNTYSFIKLIDAIRDFNLGEKVKKNNAAIKIQHGWRESRKTEMVSEALVRSKLPSPQSDVVWGSCHIINLINDLLRFYTKNSDFKDVSERCISDYKETLFDCVVELLHALSVDDSQKLICELTKRDIEFKNTFSSSLFKSKNIHLIKLFIKQVVDNNIEFTFNTKNSKFLSMSADFDIVKLIYNSEQFQNTNDQKFLIFKGLIDQNIDKKAYDEVYSNIEFLHSVSSTFTEEELARYFDEILSKCFSRWDLVDCEAVLQKCGKSVSINHVFESLSYASNKKDIRSFLFESYVYKNDAVESNVLKCLDFLSKENLSSDSYKFRYFKDCFFDVNDKKDFVTLETLPKIPERSPSLFLECLTLDSVKDQLLNLLSASEVLESILNALDKTQVLTFFDCVNSCEGENKQRILEDIFKDSVEKTSQSVELKDLFKKFKSVELLVGYSAGYKQILMKLLKNNFNIFFDFIQDRKMKDISLENLLDSSFLSVMLERERYLDNIDTFLKFCAKKNIKMQKQTHLDKIFEYSCDSNFFSFLKDRFLAPLSLNAYMMDFFIQKICEGNDHSDSLVTYLSDYGDLITTAHLSKIMNSDTISCKESYLEQLVPRDSFYPDFLEGCANKNNGKWFNIFFRSSKNEELMEWFETIAKDKPELFLTILAFKSPTTSKFILDVSLMENSSLKLSDDHLGLMIDTRCKDLTKKICQTETFRLQIAGFPDPEKYEALKSILHLGEKDVFNKVMEYELLKTCFQGNFQSLFKEAITTSVPVLVESCLKHKHSEVENLNSFFDSVLEQGNVDIFNIVIEQMTELPEEFHGILSQKTFLTHYPANSLLNFSALIKTEHIDDKVMPMIISNFVDKEEFQPFLFEIFRKVDRGLISDAYLTRLLETNFENFDLIQLCLEKIGSECIRQEHIKKLIDKCGDSPKLIEIAIEKKNEINRHIIFKLIDKGETFQDQRFSELTQLALSKMHFSQSNIRDFFSSEFKTLSAVVIDFMIANNKLDDFKSFFDTLLNTTSNKIKVSNCNDYMFLFKFLESLICIHGLQSLTNKINMKFVYNILRHFPDFVKKNKSEFKTAIISTAQAPDKTVIESLDLEFSEKSDLSGEVKDMSLGSLVLKASSNEEANYFLNQLLTKFNLQCEHFIYPTNFYDCFGYNLFTISFFGTQNFGEKDIPKGFLYYELNSVPDVDNFNGWLDIDNASLYKDTLNQVKVYFITQNSEKKLDIKLADITDPDHSDFAELPLFMKSAIIDNTISYDQYKNITHLKFIFETLSKCMDEEFKDPDNEKEYAKKMFSIMKTAMQVTSTDSFQLEHVNISTNPVESIKIKDAINRHIFFEEGNKFFPAFNDYLNIQPHNDILELAYICGQFSQSGVLGYHHGDNNQSNYLFRTLCLQCLEKYKELSKSQGVDSFIDNLKAGECIQTVMFNLQKRFSLNGFKRNTV